MMVSSLIKAASGVEAVDGGVNGIKNVWVVKIRFKSESPKDGKSESLKLERSAVLYKP